MLWYGDMYDFAMLFLSCLRCVRLGDKSEWYKDPLNFSRRLGSGPQHFLWDGKA